jgi:hypothetical protein
LGSALGVDYRDATDDSHQYRANSVEVGLINLNDGFRTGAGPRPGFELVPDYKIGWTDPGPNGWGGDWYNYTRDYGLGGLYRIYLRASHGDSSATLGGRLERVSDPASSNPNLTLLGKFRGPGTGGWDTFAFVPLRDAFTNDAVIKLSGIETLRYTAEAGGGDINYFMLVEIPPLQIHPDRGRILVTFQAMLESAENLNGPWTLLTNKLSPASFPATNAHRFFRTLSH